MIQLQNKFNVTMDELEKVRQWMLDCFTNQSRPEKDIQRDILVAVTEIFVNFVKHSRLEIEDEIQIQMDFANEILTIIFMESGEPFDITELDEPDLTALHESGYGIFIVKSLMDSFEYFPKKSEIEHNITRITKGYHHGSR